MSDQALIGTLEDSGVVRYAHLLREGGVDRAGPILLEHWTDPQEVNKLVRMGPIELLGAELGQRVRCPVVLFPKDGGCHEGARLRGYSGTLGGELDDTPSQCIFHDRDLWSPETTKRRRRRTLAKIQYLDPRIFDDYETKAVYLFYPKRREWTVYLRPRERTLQAVCRPPGVYPYANEEAV